ncbi:GNAT family N-acetyltransferase [Pseudomonas sp. NPDC089752]|uniref:GNAT family N-acetyltransferase n=1 Tax=Pseudomonas sp. NPDC089752 TaxID=3364472 RepID=UPI0038260422
MMIRATQPNDLSQLAAVERSAAQAFLQFPDLAWLATSSVMDDAAHLSFLGNGCSWVAEEEGKILGFICASVQCQALHIEEVSVRGDAQGQGIGRQLLTRMIEEARHKGLGQVTLTTFSNVPWNAPFYQRHGFEVIADADLDIRLSSLLASEYALGLSGRCAMRLRLP